MKTKSNKKLFCLKTNECCGVQQFYIFESKKERNDYYKYELLCSGDYYPLTLTIKDIKEDYGDTSKDLKRSINNQLYIFEHQI